MQVRVDRVQVPPEVLAKSLGFWDNYGHAGTGDSRGDWSSRGFRLLRSSGRRSGSPCGVAAACLRACWSVEAAKSAEVSREIQRARERVDYDDNPDTRFVVLRLDDTPLPEQLLQRQYINHYRRGNVRGVPAVRGVPDSVGGERHSRGAVPNVSDEGWQTGRVLSKGAIK